MRYDKLVRDRIPEFIRSKGQECLFRVAGRDELRGRLADKLVEEAREFAEDGSVEEFADVMEVIEAIAELYGFDAEEVRRIRDQKAAERGRFREGIILEEA